MKEVVEKSVGKEQWIVKGIIDLDGKIVRNRGVKVRLVGEFYNEVFWCSKEDSGMN